MKLRILDFSGVYENEGFWKGEEDVSWFSLRDIPGTNCYCDQEAMEELRRRVGSLPVPGIHFLDSGNYHYMSRLLMERIHEPFRLLVFDNHTDMQPPAFGGLLSCGGWIESALKELENLREVYLVGPSQEDFLRTEEALRNRVRLLSGGELAQKRKEGPFRLLEDFPGELPLYLSIDKDVLGEEYAATGWSQGEMSLTELLSHLEDVLGALAKKGGRILGVDICGEGGEVSGDHGKNDRANGALLSFFQKRLTDTGAPFHHQKGETDNEK